MTPPAMAPVFVFEEGDDDDVAEGFEADCADAVGVGVDEDVDDEVLAAPFSNRMPFPSAQHWVALI